MGYGCVFLLVPKKEIRAWVYRSFTAQRRVERQKAREALADGERMGLEEESSCP